MLLYGAARDKKLDIDTDPDLKAVVIDHMRVGYILDVVRSDALIMRYGAAMLRKSGPTKGKLIAQRMRQMTWLKMEVNKDPTLASLSVLDLLAPQYVDDVVNAVKSISQSSVSERGQQVLSKPSLALQIGQSIVKCCNLKKGLGIRSRDKAMTAAAEQFLVLHIAEWTDEVSSTPLASMKVKKNYTVAELPNTSDFLKLKQYCKSRMSELTDKLNSGASERKSGPTKGKLIAQRMRQMTWLKMEVNKDPTRACLFVLDLLAPEYVDDVVNAVKSIAQSSVSERGQQVLSKPSLALQIGQSIVKCCNLKKGALDPVTKP